MGTNYTQHCILGIKVTPEECKRVLVETQYDEQPRYDTKTGKQTHTEKVLVRQEESVYRFMDCEADFMYELGEEIATKYDLDMVHDGGYGDDSLYVGKSIGTTKDYGRVDLIEGSVSTVDLANHMVKLEKIVGDKPIRLYFVGNIG